MLAVWCHTCSNYARTAYYYDFEEGFDRELLRTNEASKHLALAPPQAAPNAGPEGFHVGCVHLLSLH